MKPACSRGRPVSSLARLEFVADPQADRPRAGDDGVDFRALGGHAVGVAAHGFEALHALGDLAADVEQILDVEIEAPRAFFEAGGGIDQPI